MALHPTHAVSVCSGYGGIDLGLRLALGGRCRTILYCEREAYPATILAGQMENGFLDPAPVWSDLHTLPARGIIDRLGLDPQGVMLHGGIPCQPWSCAGERRGAEDGRWLWPAVWNIVQECGLGWLMLENVRGFVSGDPAGIDLVLRDLSLAGWNAEWDLFSAAQCGAPHERERFFLLAHSGQKRCGQKATGRSPESRYELADAGGEGFEGRKRRGALCEQGSPASESVAECGAGLWPSRPGEEQHAWEAPRIVVYTKNAGHQRRQRQAVSGQRVVEGAGATGRRSQTESGLGGIPDGPAGGLDAALAKAWSGRISALGNGVVPIVAALAYVALRGRLKA